MHTFHRICDWPQGDSRRRCLLAAQASTTRALATCDVRANAADCRAARARLQCAFASQNCGVTDGHLGRAPALPKKLFKLGANPPYVYSLAVIMALLAIVTVPLSLAALSAFFDREASVPLGQVATVITTGFLAPLVAGMVVRYFRPTLAERIGEPLITAAGIVLLVLILLIVATNFSVIVGIGLPAFLLYRCDDACLFGGRPCPGWTRSERSHNSGRRLCDSFSRPRFAHCLAELSQRQAAADRGGLLINRQPDGDPLYALAQNPTWSTKPGAIKHCRSKKVTDRR